MSFTVAILFLHILGAMGFGVSLAIEWLVSIQLQRASHMAQVLQLMRVSKGLPAIGVPSILLTLATGLILAAGNGSWGNAWIVLSLVSLGLLIVVGASLTAPSSLALQKAVAAAQGTDVVAADLRRSFGNRTLALALRLKTMLLIGLVYLMTGHPGTVEAVLCSAVALAIGAAWTLVGKRVPLI